MSRKRQRVKPIHLVTEVPRSARCPQCRRAVLAGHLYGIPSLYDPQHLSRKGEGEAIIRRLRTFHVNIDGSHLSERTLTGIKRDPKPRWGHIIREHRCTAPDPDPRGVEEPVRHSKRTEPDF